MHNNWTSLINTAMASWENQLGDYFDYTLSANNATVRYCGILNLPAWWEPNVAATTLLRDTYGVWMFDYDTGATNNYGNWFSYSHIYVNKYFDDNDILSDANKQRTIAHELGHVLLLGHPANSAVSSVMHQGEVGGYNSLTPTTKDKNDVINMYN